MFCAGPATVESLRMHTAGQLPHSLYELPTAANADTLKLDFIAAIMIFLVAIIVSYLFAHLVW